jgi:hypothetical protein
MSPAPLAHIPVSVPVVADFPFTVAVAAVFDGFPDYRDSHAVSGI